MAKNAPAPKLPAPRPGYDIHTTRPFRVPAPAKPNVSKPPSLPSK